MSAYTEIFQHNSLNLGLILQVFRHHGPWQMTARGAVQVS
jgi:hypothetical protein